MNIPSFRPQFSAKAQAYTPIGVQRKLYNLQSGEFVDIGDPLSDFSITGKAYGLRFKSLEG